MRLRFLLIAVLLMAPMAFAGNYSLNDWCFYVNSLNINHSCNNGSGIDNFAPPVSPGTFDFQHLTDNNLGTAVVTLPPGTYNVFAIFNYDIDAGGKLNEYATAVGSLAIGQVYSVDAEHDSTGGTPGNLYGQFASGTLDNTNHLSSGNEDVSASIGFTNVTVPDGSTGTIQFVVGNTPPTSGFYIEQQDNAGGPPIFISENIQIDGGLGAQLVTTPEPGTISLMVGGIALMALKLRRRKA
jgi:hypothetical protein